MKKLMPLVTYILLLSLMLLVAGCPDRTAKAVGKTKPIDGFPEASVTIFPLTVFWEGLEDLSEEAHAWANAFMSGFRQDARSFTGTLGLLLAEKGYDKYEIADVNFELPKGTPTRQDRTAAFAKFVGEQHLKTDYALNTEFTIFADKSGFYVYSVIVDANGNLAWADDREYRGKMVFDCLEVACSRLTPVMGLDQLPKKEMAEDQKRSLWELRAKEPPGGAEFKAMDKRLESMKQAASSARILVYPPRVGGGHTDPNCATHLCELLNDAKLCQASASKMAPLMECSGWPNEMHVLWLFARRVKEFLREHPTDSDYVLFPDYWFNPRGEVWAVHFVVCDQGGDWVIADLQNSHHENFQRVSPKNLEDCNRLVVERLRAKLR
jgi:hypothetical protein